MRRAAIWSGRVLAALLILAFAAAIWQREALGRLLAVNSLFAEDRIVRNFSHMDDLFLHVEMPRAASVSPLPAGPRWQVPPDVARWIEARAVTGIVILHRGAVVHEDYRLGTAAEDRRISWSLAKSFLSVLTGILLAEGAIPSLDMEVTEAAPALRGTAYDGVTLRQVLQMSSGVAFDEDYLDFWSDINRMGRILALGGSMDGFAAARRDRTGPAGATWAYNSIDTHVAAMVLRGATGRSLAELMSDRLLRPLGLESAPVYLTDGEGVEFALGGLLMTTRDYARFGQMVANGGIWQGVRIVPAAWIDESIRPSAPTAAGAPRYGYFWWIPQGWPEGGAVLARGVYGQYLAIDRARNVVVAVNAADRRFEEPGVEAADFAMLLRIMDSVAGG